MNDNIVVGYEVLELELDSSQDTECAIGKFLTLWKVQGMIEAGKKKPGYDTNIPGSTKLWR